MLKSINKVIKIMVYSDLIMVSGWGLVAPILAIFIVQNIKGGDVKVAGIAIGIYWLIKSILQLPIAHYLDKNHGEKDDFYALVGGSILTSLVPIGFIFATLPWHMYVLQAIHAITMASVIPSWSGIFTRHIEKRREAFCWSLESSSIGVGAGIAGIVGGIIVKTFGSFVPLLIGVSILELIASFLLLLIKKELLLKPKKEKILTIPKVY